MEKDLFTKSIYSEREDSDGKRVSVMSRHTKEDGITPDERIIEGYSFDEWMKELAPPPNLVGAYLRKELGWDDYEAEYLKYLQSPEVSGLVSDFAERCNNEIITLLCAEKSAENCHRRVLAEELKRLQPSLRITHKA